jgi:hypothetical protein
MDQRILALNAALLFTDNELPAHLPSEMEYQSSVARRLNS